MPVIPHDNPVAVRAQHPRDIVGIIRFSLVLQDSSFFPLLAGQTFAQRQANIFARERLQRRLAIFEKLCLPSLTGQSDQNFNVILATSRDLPEWAFERLSDMVAQLPNIYVRAYRAQANIRRVYKRSAFEMLDPTAKVVATFRIDDDDALAIDYIARLRAHTVPQNIGKIVTFTNGHQLSLSGGAMTLQHDTRPYGSVGLACVNAGGAQSIPDVQTIYGFGAHRNVARHAPVIEDGFENAYVQTANGFNVSARIVSADARQDTPDDIARTLTQNFPHLGAAT